MLKRVASMSYSDKKNFVLSLINITGVFAGNIVGYSWLNLNIPIFFIFLLYLVTINNMSVCQDIHTLSCSTRNVLITIIL